MPKRPYLIFILFIIFSLTCAGFNGSVFKGQNTSYKIGPLPVEWQEIKDENKEVNLIFWKKSKRQTIVVNSVCEGINPEATPRILTGHLLYGFTSTKIVKQQSSLVSGQEALRTTLEATLDNSPLMLDLYVLKQGKCVFDLQYFASPENFNGGVKEFEDFVKGFQVLKAKEK